MAAETSPARVGGCALELDDLPVAAVLLVAGRIVTTNDGARSLLAGSPTEELDGRRLSDLVVEDDRVRLDEALSSGVETPTVRLALEPPRWIEVAITRRDDDAALVVLTDVTEQARSRRLLRELFASVAIAGPQGERQWGPIGRTIPLDDPARPGSVVDRIHPEDLSEALTAWTRVQEEPGRSVSVEVRICDVDMGGRWTVGRAELTNLRHIPEIDGLAITLTERDEVESVDSIGRTSGNFLSVAEAAPVGIVVTGPVGFPAYFNQAAMRLLPGVGVGAAERDWTTFARTEDRDVLRAMVQDVIEQRRSTSMLACFHPAGAEDSWLLVTAAPREVEDGRLVGLVITLQDVSGEVQARRLLEDAQERLIHLATHDPLTGLANRTLLADELDAAGGLTAVAQARSALFFCDLDGFKAINDAHGHETGDRFLVEVAARLRAVVRPTDVVGRLGGDEFIVLLRDIDEAGLEICRARIQASLDEPVTIDDRSLAAGVSIGVAWLEPGESAHDALRRADHAMYDQKVARRRPMSD